MKSRNLFDKRSGFTLVELLVVIAILVVLSALVIPRLSGLTDQSNSAQSAANIGDVSRLIQTFEAKYNHSPAHMATLRTGSDGTGDLIPAIHPGLAALVQKADLTPLQMKSLNDAGIGHAHAHNMPAGFGPSDTDGDGDVFFSFGTSAPVTVLNLQDASNFVPTTWKDSTVTLARGLGISPFKSNYKDTFVCFGVGNLAELKGKVMQEAPLFTGANPEKYWARAIAVYEIPSATATTGFKAFFVGVIGPDGTILSQNMSNYATAQAQ